MEDVNHAQISSEDWQVFSWGRVCTWLSVYPLQLAPSSVAETTETKKNNEDLKTSKYCLAADPCSADSTIHYI